MIFQNNARKRMPANRLSAIGGLFIFNTDYYKQTIYEKRKTFFLPNDLQSEKLLYFCTRFQTKERRIRLVVQDNCLSRSRSSVRLRYAVQKATNPQRFVAFFMVIICCLFFFIAKTSKKTKKSKIYGAGRSTSRTAATSWHHI